MGKTEFETAWWKARNRDDHGVFDNTFYERLMLGMAGEPDQTFLAGKVVADFGCGPRGSLMWADQAQLRIGIDVLAARYATDFPTSVLSHGMVYVTSTEKIVPMPDACVDVMFTLNAIDHVDDFAAMCNEILRLIKPRGLFVGSFNLNEPWTSSEPQTLTEADIKQHMLHRLDVESYRIARQSDAGYEPFFRGELGYSPGERAYLWVRGTKPAARA